MYWHSSTVCFCWTSRLPLPKVFSYINIYSWLLSGTGHSNLVQELFKGLLQKGAWWLLWLLKSKGDTPVHPFQLWQFCFWWLCWFHCWEKYPHKYPIRSCPTFLEFKMVMAAMRHSFLNPNWLHIYTFLSSHSGSTVPLQVNKANSQQKQSLVVIC